MARQLWDGRDYGRNDFDSRAGYEWESGPVYYDTTGIAPDVSWKMYKPGNRLLWDNGRWAVTSYGLEPLYSSLGDKYESFGIPTHSLLDIFDHQGVYDWPILVAREHWLDLDRFEEAFRRAIELHRCKVDERILEVSFRRARGPRGTVGYFVAEACFVID